jgi:hypothetical protein
MKITDLILLLFVAAIAACQDSVSEKYVALKETPLYREPSDGTQDVSYIVKEGEVCYFGNEVTKKVYRFKEVTCEDGRGWTPDWMDFKKIERRPD